MVCKWIRVPHSALVGGQSWMTTSLFLLFFTFAFFFFGGVGAAWDFTDVGSEEEFCVCCQQPSHVIRGLETGNRLAGSDQPGVVKPVF
jgi:hypothetical protein